ncbi:T-cell leukemia/lymphoma protein 1B-like [Erinaceus europaeus]|uniref:T-cell leukemia/lymphoma protein 1B-like n=1 Tax=Erinaceus europaeus TaxID=9365 RepID=A0ABM3WL99_ERIEU|nr:T-cell leukemia/lymphoma protein 1B-like [Erinaceus europaeus]
MTHVSTHPDRLWIRQRTVYVDEHQRVWRANLIPVGTVRGHPPWAGPGQTPDTALPSVGLIPQIKQLHVYQDMHRYNKEQGERMLALRGLGFKPPALLAVRNNIQVHLRYRGELPTGEALSPREIGSNPLPSMWQLYSSKRYRGSNSNHWHIAYHIRATRML